LDKIQFCVKDSFFHRWGTFMSCNVFTALPVSMNYGRWWF
jgi:hypothetical protein